MALKVKKRTSARKNMPPKMSIRSGDEVVVLAGKDKGKHGKVIEVRPAQNRVIVEGVNMVKRHMRRQQGSLQAGIIDKPAPLDRSNVMLICPNCGKPSRESRTILPDGRHARVCKKCGEIIDRER